MKLRDIGIGNKTNVAESPKCGEEECQKCDHKDNCGSVIVGDQFKSKEEVIGFAISVCEEWDCPHTMIFIKFKNNECALGVHEFIGEYDDNDEEIYDWNVYRIKWNEISKIRPYIAEHADIHFAVVMEQNKDGNFKMIEK